MLALLLLPAIQAKFQLVELMPLSGYSEAAPEPDFSPETVFDNSYQPALDKYLEEQIGFRPWMIRLRNQLAYSVFKLDRANNTVLGIDDMMFDGRAADSYLGRDFVGEAEIDRNVRRFKDVQDTLASHGTLLVFVIAPGKSDIYSDMMPADYRNAPHTRSNYTAYAEKLAAANVNLLDMSALFRHWRDTSAYPVFPRGGIHWSLWARDLAVDTLFDYVRQRGHFNFPDCYVTNREVSNIPRDTDDDLAKVLNLFKEPEAFRMSYQKLEFTPLQPGQRKPNLLLVGDSFAWGIVAYLSSVFSPESHFWYYNTEVQWSGAGGLPEQKQVNQLDKRVELKGRDVVLVLYTEPNLTAFDNYFSASVYKAYHPYTAADNLRIQGIKQQLMQDTALTSRLQERAYHDNIPLTTLFEWEAIGAFDKIR
ncbi:alginate O-acetyltransferase AlgX-related protein [Hymenobacter terricola]|uniref:alginate O-acetyltransferase AlgX-related protein n=1 Tax=Hymenobacter terricola TaxID=2819236 RepID=UPI001B30453C|nr:hypothetical protein [Hymenobacter terricola]